MADRPGLTPARRETITRAIEAGIAVTKACEIAGVHPTTFHRWMRGTRPVERSSRGRSRRLGEGRGRSARTSH